MKSIYARVCQSRKVRRLNMKREERWGKNETFAVGGNYKKKKKGSAMLTFQKRQSHRGKSRSSGIKTEVRYHVCACMCGNPCTDGPIFFFFSVTNVAIKLLKRSNCCTKKRMAVRISRQNISNVHYPYIWYSINEMIIYIFVITTYWIFARVYSNCQ